MLYSSLGSGGMRKYFAALELVRHLTANPLPRKSDARE